MDKDFFRISHIQKKIDNCHSSQKVLKVVLALQILIIFYHCRFLPESILGGWLISIPLIGLFYYLDVFYIKKEKFLEYELYTLQMERLERKKRVAQITGDTLPDYELNQNIDVPTEEMSDPILYYAAILALDVLMGMSTFL